MPGLLIPTAQQPLFPAGPPTTPSHAAISWQAHSDLSSFGAPSTVEPPQDNAQAGTSQQQPTVIEVAFEEHDPDTTSTRSAFTSEESKVVAHAQGQKSWTIGRFLHSVLTWGGFHCSSGKGSAPSKDGERTEPADGESYIDQILGEASQAQEAWRKESTAPAFGKKIPSSSTSHRYNSTAFWTSGSSDPSAWSDNEKRLRQIPDYVIRHAPLVYLFSGEAYWPGDIGEHLEHVTPFINYDPIGDGYETPTVDNLADLNDFGPYVFLQSNDNVEDDPPWLRGEWNIPKVDGQTSDIRGDPRHVPGKTRTRTSRPSKQPDLYDEDFDKWFRAEANGSPSYMDADQVMEDEKQSFTSEAKQAFANMPDELKRRMESEGGRSDAPVLMFVVPKGDDVVDAFWFFFYSYNLGNQVFNTRFGNHVGDWEHTAIRFYKGKPKLVFYSEHEFGQAYAWEAVEKMGDRVIAYSATGTHAMYGTAGTHTYVLPFGLLYDITDRGPLWDPTLNMYSFTYDADKDILRSSNLTPHAPTSWFFYSGRWGDKAYPMTDPRQYRFLGQYHYVTGPTGPRYKRLNRVNICPGREEDPCIIRSLVADENLVRWGHSPNEREQLGEEGSRMEDP